MGRRAGGWSPKVGPWVRDWKGVWSLQRTVPVENGCLWKGPCSTRKSSNLQPTSSRERVFTPAHPPHVRPVVQAAGSPAADASFISWTVAGGLQHHGQCLLQSASSLWGPGRVLFMLLSEGMGLHRSPSCPPSRVTSPPFLPRLPRDPLLPVESSCLLRTGVGGDRPLTVLPLLVILRQGLEGLEGLRD